MDANEYTYSTTRHAPMVTKSANSPPSHPASTANFVAVNGSSLAASYRAVRSATEALCEPLTCEDCVIQSMPDASPVKWHLAHTTWFFETFVLAPHLPSYRPFHPEFGFLFNSYYQ